MGWMQRTHSVELCVNGWFFFWVPDLYVLLSSRSRPLRSTFQSQDGRWSWHAQWAGWPADTGRPSRWWCKENTHAHTTSETHPHTLIHTRYRPSSGWYKTNTHARTLLHNHWRTRIHTFTHVIDRVADDIRRTHTHTHNDAHSLTHTHTHIQTRYRPSSWWYKKVTHARTMTHSLTQIHTHLDTHLHTHYRPTSQWFTQARRTQTLTHTNAHIHTLWRTLTPWHRHTNTHTL